MTTINLTQFFFGRRKRKKNKGGGSGVPTPSLPNAGKPKVTAFNYDKDTRKVTVVASVERAGEVKDPEGEEQEFPIHVPTPPAPPAPTLPDAGKPRVSKFDYDPATRKVTVQASVSQAGEVKTPLGDEQTFNIPEEAAFTGIVHKYNVRNNKGRTPFTLNTGTGEAPVVNGESVPLSIELQPGQDGVVYSPISKFELNTVLSIGALAGKTKFNRDVLYYTTEAITLSRTTEGYLLIERSVVSKD